MTLSVTLRNNTRNTSKVGYAVIVDPADRNAFIYAPANATEILGIISESVKYRELCKIITSGETTVFVQGNPRKGDIIRSRITNDNLPSGACKVAHVGDVPYPQVGIALETGVGLVRCRLFFTYHMSEDPFNIADYVPYLGATGDVNLGTHAILAGSGRIGSGTDYTNFNTIGHQTMVGAARTWRDEVGDALGLRSSGTGITLSLAELTQDFAFNATYNANPLLADFLYKNLQLNHDKDLTTSIYPHIHWFQSKNFSPNFLLEYRWQKLGIAKVTAWTQIVCNNLMYTYVSGTIEQKSATVAIAVPVDTSMSDIVQFRIYRDTTNASGLFAGTDPYNTGGNASTPVLSFDVHLVVNDNGSTTQDSK